MVFSMTVKELDRKRKFQFQQCHGTSGDESAANLHSTSTENLQLSEKVHWLYDLCSQ